MTDSEIIQLLTQKLQETVDENDRLRAENARLKEGLTAHETLRLIYSDPDAPQGLRVKAAQAALNVEMPRIQSVPPAVAATCEEVIPLAQLVEQRRARQIALQGRDIEVSPSGAVRVLPKPGSNGSGDDDDNFG